MVSSRAFVVSAFIAGIAVVIYLIAAAVTAAGYADHKAAVDALIASDVPSWAGWWVYEGEEHYLLYNAWLYAYNPVAWHGIAILQSLGTSVIVVFFVHFGGPYFFVYFGGYHSSHQW